MLFLSSTAFILMWFDISIFIFLKFILGGLKPYSQEIANPDLNNFTSIGNYLYRTSSGYDYAANHAPTGNDSQLIVLACGAYILQLVNDQVNGLYVRHKSDRGGWSDWGLVAINIPSFYKNYADLSSLATALGVIGHGYPYSIISSVGANQQAFIGTLKEETPYVVIIKNSGYTGILSIFYIRNSLVAKKCLLEYDGANFADAIVCPVYNTTTADIYFKPTENRTNVYYKVIEL